MDEIINKVAQSNLLTFDLEDYYVTGERMALDISDWLHEGIVLREKEFRDKAKNYDWEQYKDAYVALYCTSDAIIPAWAFMLISSYLIPHVKKVVIGNMESLETSIYQDILNNMDFSTFKDKPIIVKGCSKKSVPQNAYILAMEKLQPVVRSIFYGEACSSVPLYKKRKD